jgi:hypothetical protein
MNEWLPALILLNDHNGSWGPYIEEVYRRFHRDFVQSLPLFRGQRMGLKRHPIEKDKEATFWHLTSEGKIEAERLHDLRRCERICWPRPMIEHEIARKLPVWNQSRSGEHRIAIAVEDFSYILVLATRKTSNGLMYLPWTAFCVEHEHQRRKYRRQWETDPLKG